MKKIIRKIEALGQKSAQLQQALEGVPERIAHFRETVAMTAGQLQQLRSDLQASVAELRIDNEERLLQALKEIKASTSVFEEAGFALAGVEMELSPAHRLIVHFDKLEEVSSAALKSILAANQPLRTTRALLASLACAQETSCKVDLGDLVCSHVVVHVGPLPALRLCWNPEPAEETSVPALLPASVTLPPASTPAPVPAFVQSSYFEKWSSPRPAPVPASEPSPAVPAPERAPRPEAAASPGPPADPAKTDWRRSALERFKKMPDVSKYPH